MASRLGVSRGTVRESILNLVHQGFLERRRGVGTPSAIVLGVVVVLIVGPKLFIEPGTKAFVRLSSVSGPGL
jgi:DNA-binding Lrp family transcriptional regulator